MLTPPVYTVDTCENARFLRELLSRTSVALQRGNWFLHQPPLLSLQVEDFYLYVHVHAVESVVDLGTKLLDVLPVLDTHEYL